MGRAMEAPPVPWAVPWTPSAAVDRVVQGTAPLNGVKNLEFLGIDARSLLSLWRSARESK